MPTISRKDQLTKQVNELEAQRLAAHQACHQLERDLDVARSEVARLTEEHGSACEALARGRKADAQSTEVRLSNARERVIGFERLATAKRVEVERIATEQSAPLAELQALIDEEHDASGASSMLMVPPFD